MSEQSWDENLDMILIIQVLLEHERRLESLEDELESIVERLTEVNDPEEHLPSWLRRSDGVKWRRNLRDYL